MDLGAKAAAGAAQGFRYRGTFFDRRRKRAPVQWCCPRTLPASQGRRPPADARPSRSRARSSATYGGRAAVLFADMLRDRLLLVDLSIVNNPASSQGLLLYQDRAGRRPWALALSHFVNPQFDRLAPALSFYQREF